MSFYQLNAPCLQSFRQLFFLKLHYIVYYLLILLCNVKTLVHFYPHPICRHRFDEDRNGLIIQEESLTSAGDGCSVNIWNTLYRLGHCVASSVRTSRMTTFLCSAARLSVCLSFCVSLFVSMHPFRCLVGYFYFYTDRKRISRHCTKQRVHVCQRLLHLASLSNHAERRR